MLAFIISIIKSDIHLIGSSLAIMCLSFQAGLRIFSLCPLPLHFHPPIFSSLTMMYLGVLFFDIFLLKVNRVFRIWGFVFHHFVGKILLILSSFHIALSQSLLSPPVKCIEDILAISHISLTIFSVLIYLFFFHFKNLTDFPLTCISVSKACVLFLQTLVVFSTALFSNSVIFPSAVFNLW